MNVFNKLTTILSKARGAIFCWLFFMVGAACALNFGLQYYHGVLAFPRGICRVQSLTKSEVIDGCHEDNREIQVYSDKAMPMDGNVTCRLYRCPLLGRGDDRREELHFYGTTITLDADNEGNDFVGANSTQQCSTFKISEYDGNAETCEEKALPFVGVDLPCVIAIEGSQPSCVSAVFYKHLVKSGLMVATIPASFLIVFAFGNCGPVYFQWKRL